MGIFSSGKELKKLKEQVKRLQLSNNNSLLNFNRQVAIYPDWDIKDGAERYTTTDDIYSIVRMLSNTASLIPFYGYEITDEKTAKQLYRIKQPHNAILQTKALELKAMEDLPETDLLTQLLEYPSTTLSKTEFFEAIYIHLNLNGEIFLLKERPELGVNAGKPVSLLIMHPDNVVINVTDTLPREVVSYSYIMEGKPVFTNIDKDDVIHIKYYNPRSDIYGSELRGLSPLKVLSRRLTHMDSNEDVQVAQMQNGGINNIVFDKVIPDEEATEVMGSRKDNFYRYLKNKSNIGTPFFAAGEMGSINLGSTLADLKVIEAANIDFKKVCNVFGTSDILFNNGEASTESNVKIMTARTYTNTILPNIYRVRDALKKGLLNDYKDGIKRDIREDISEITELQPNMKELTEWLEKAWWVAPNLKLEMQKFEKIDNPIFDLPFIPTGLQTTDDLIQIPDLPE